MIQVIIVVPDGGYTTLGLVQISQAFLIDKLKPTRRILAQHIDPTKGIQHKWTEIGEDLSSKEIEWLSNPQVFIYCGSSEQIEKIDSSLVNYKAAWNGEEIQFISFGPVEFSDVESLLKDFARI